MEIKLNSYITTYVQKSTSFPVPTKNPEQFKEYKEFQKHWATWNSMYGITCILQLPFIPPKLRVPLVILETPQLPQI